MTSVEIYDAWSPSGAAWSAWVKPVLFATVSAAQVGPSPVIDQWRPTWLPDVSERLVFVVDLPGELGVAIGLALATSGWRPIPLYNAHPGPELDTTASDEPPVSAVDVFSIQRAIVAGTADLQKLNLPLDAPPAFLLDAKRRGRGPSFIEPGQFDNRSISFATDFPSANLLLSSGYRRVIVLQESLAAPQADLCHTLIRWQSAGMTVEIAGLDLNQKPCLHIVKPVSWLAKLWHGLIAGLGFRANPLGGFGGLVPVPGTG